MSDAHESCDREGVARVYLEHRQGPDNPTDATERPTFLRLVGGPSRPDVVALGCGTGGDGVLDQL